MTAKSSFLHSHLVKKSLFGPFLRYAAITRVSRFGNLHYLIEDAEKPDELTSLPSVIFQSDSESELTTRVRELSESEEVRA
jgi:hypothetical protein